MSTSTDARTTPAVGPSPPDAGAAAPAEGLASALFGRGLLYVLVWSFQIVSATLVSPVLAHLLGPTQFGMLASAIALYQVLLVVAVVGLDQTVVVQRARGSGDATARELLALGIGLAFVVSAVAGASSPWWAGALRFDSEPALLAATIGWVGPGAAVQLMLASLMAQDRFRAFAVISALSAIGGQVFGLGLLLGLGGGAGVYAWGGVISQVAAMVVGVALTCPRPVGLVRYRAAGRALTMGIPLMLSGISLFVLGAGDRIVIQRLLGAAAVGRYQVAYTVGDVVALLLTFVSQAWVPRLLAVSEERARWAAVRQSRDGLYRLLIPVFLGVNLGAPLLLRIVAPASYRPETLLVVVALVAAAAFPIAAAGASGRALLSLDRTRALALSAGAAALGNILLNLVLVPVAGLAGSAAATVLAFGGQAIAQRLALRDRARRWGSPPALVVGIGTACLAAAALAGLPQDAFWIAVRTVAAAACVGWFALGLRGLQRAPGKHRHDFGGTTSW